MLQDVWPPLTAWVSPLRLAEPVSFILHLSRWFFLNLRALCSLIPGGRSLRIGTLWPLNKQWLSITMYQALTVFGVESTKMKRISFLENSETSGDRHTYKSQCDIALIQWRCEEAQGHRENPDCTSLGKPAWHKHLPNAYLPILSPWGLGFQPGKLDEGDTAPVDPNT